MNIITVAGVIGRDAEKRYLTNGDAVCNFTIADDQGKDKPPIWWRCSLFGKRADSLRNYLVKGTPVTVAGQVTERDYQDKDGTPKKATEIRVTDVKLQGKREQSANQAPAKTQDKAPAKGGGGFEDMEDDIPF